MLKYDETGYKEYFLLGKKAKLEGKHHEVCPFRKGHSSRLAWLDGYRSVLAKRTVTKAKFDLGKVVEPYSPPPAVDAVVKSTAKEQKSKMKRVEPKYPSPIRKPGGVRFRVM